MALALAGLACVTPSVAAQAAPASQQPVRERSLQIPVEVEPGPPLVPAPPALLSARRGALLDAIGRGAVALPAAMVKSIEGDYPQDSDFRQHNDFFYLTGLETPDAWLLLTAAGDGSRAETLFLPEPDPRQERWTGRRLSHDEAAEISGIADVRPLGELEGVLRGSVFELAPPLTLYGALDRAVRNYELIERIGLEAPVPVADLDRLLAPLRLVKDEHEIRTLRRAIEITVGAHRAAMRAARPGMWEYELEAVIELNFKLGGAERVGFPSIVGSGPNSVVLHYDKSRRRMEEGELIVIDIGAEYSYYSADVTRTIPVSGRFTPRQRRVYELVLGAQRAAIEAVRPGVTIRELEGVARSWLRERSGGACGLSSCDAYFIHGLSHWLGMDVHDVGSYATPLAPGMVLTIEPGIYLPDEGLGVRIEDDVLVTEEGHEVLSGAAPSDPDEIEALMRGRESP